MTDLRANTGDSLRLNENEWDMGGLHFYVFYTVGHGVGRGATGKVFGSRNGTWVELLRFCDFPAEPHFHAPAEGPQINFDPSQGEPLPWFGSQIRDHLVALLNANGFADIVPTIDLGATTEMAERFENEMKTCVPDETGLTAAIATWAEGIAARGGPRQR